MREFLRIQLTLRLRQTEQLLTQISTAIESFCVRRAPADTLAIFFLSSANDHTIPKPIALEVSLQQNTASNKRSIRFKRAVAKVKLITFFSRANVKNCSEKFVVSDRMDPPNVLNKPSRNCCSVSRLTRHMFVEVFSAGLNALKDYDDRLKVFVLVACH